MNQLVFLRTFLAVYRAGSVTRAAPQLGLTQPAVSGHLKGLETALARELFVRRGRGIAPTAAAHTLAQRIGPYLDALEGALDAARMTSDTMAGTVHLGGPAELMTCKVLPSLSALPARSIMLRTHFGLADALIDAVGTGGLDIAVSTVRINRPGVAYEPLYEETFVLVGAPKWQALLPKGHRDRLPFSRLAILPWLAFAEDLPIIRRYLRKVFGREHDLVAALVAPDLRALMSAAEAGMGITVLPRYLVEPSLANGRLIEIVTPETEPANTIYLAWSRSAARHPRIATVKDLLLAAARNW